MKRYLLIILLGAFISESTQAQTWSNVGGGLNWNVYDLITFNDTLYAAGRLGLPNRGVFYWDENEWVNTAYFWGISYPLTLAEYNNELYTAGGPDWDAGDPTRVYKWTEDIWEQQGADFGIGGWNTVQKLISNDGYLYAGGNFEIEGCEGCKNITRWDGMTWTAVNNGIPHTIHEMDILNDNLLVNHATIDTIYSPDSTYVTLQRHKLQELQSNTWFDLDSIFEYKNINLVGVIENEVYFSSFDTIGGTPINGLGIWDGNSITSIGDDLIHSVTDIEKLDNEIYISCELNIETTPWAFDDATLKRVDNNWESSGGIFDKSILKLHVHQSNLYSAGFFEEYENEAMNYVSKLIQDPSEVAELETTSIEVFPNPFNNKIIVMADYSLKSNVQLFSITGELILNRNFEAGTLIEMNLTGFAKGIYILNLTNKSGLWQKRVIKN